MSRIFGKRLWGKGGIKIMIKIKIKIKRHAIRWYTTFSSSFAGRQRHSRCISPRLYPWSGKAIRGSSPRSASQHPLSGVSYPLSSPRSASQHPLSGKAIRGSSPRSASQHPLSGKAIRGSSPRSASQHPLSGEAIRCHPPGRPLSIRCPAKLSVVIPPLCLSASVVRRSYPLSSLIPRKNPRPDSRTRIRG